MKKNSISGAFMVAYVQPEKEKIIFGMNVGYQQDLGVKVVVKFRGQSEDSMDFKEFLKPALLK